MREGSKRCCAPKRVYTKVLFGLVAGVALIDLALAGLGFLDRGAFRALGQGFVLILFGALAWEVVERHETGGGKLRFLAWFALPAAILLAFAALPFLALSVYPELGEFFTRQGRVEARMEEALGRLTLDILFPHAMEPAGLNLKLDSTPVPETYASEPAGGKAPAAVRWLSPRTARIDLERIIQDLAIPRPRTVSINTLPLAPRFRFENGEAVPPQTVVLK